MAAAASDWKLTSDHLPPNDTWVLTRQVDGTIWTGKYVRGCWRVSGKMGSVPRYKITHWAEIYQPPKDKPNANNTTKQTTTQQTNKDICKGSQAPQAASTITTSTTPTVEARD